MCVTWQSLIKRFFGAIREPVSLREGRSVFVVSRHGAAPGPLAARAVTGPPTARSQGTSGVPHAERAVVAQGTGTAVLCPPLVVIAGRAGRHGPLTHSLSWCWLRAGFPMGNGAGRVSLHGVAWHWRGRVVLAR